MTPLPFQICCRNFLLILVVSSDHTIAKFHHTVCHILDGIVVGNHDYGISVFMVDGFDQLEDFLGCIVIQSTGRLVAEQDVRIFYNGTANGSSLLLASGKLIGKFPLMFIKSQGSKQFIHIQRPVT